METSCTHPSAYLGVHIITTGEKRPCWVCPVCDRIVTAEIGKHSGHYLPKSQLPPDAHIWRDDTDPDYAAKLPRCAVKGCEWPARLHHMLPVDVAGRAEADRWPMVHLCGFHHWEWHRRVTPKTYDKMLTYAKPKVLFDERVRLRAVDDGQGVRMDVFGLGTTELPTHLTSGSTYRVTFDE